MKKIYKADIDSPCLLEKFLREDAGISARLLRKLKQPPNSITREGSLVRTIDMVYPGDLICLETAEKNEIEPNGSVFAETVYEDEDIVIYNKPSEMPVHPSHRHRDDTLANYFVYTHRNSTFRAVNRLDRNTSGGCVVAKSQQAAADFGERGRRRLKKVYYALVMGRTEEEGTIDAPIAREGETIIRRCISEKGQRAVTHYKKLRGNEAYSFLEIELETGRTHQIRVHMSSIGHPLFGDDLYGGSRELIDRQALHCGRMIIDGRVFDIALPEDMQSLMEHFERRSSDPAANRN